LCALSLSQDSAHGGAALAALAFVHSLLVLGDNFLSLGYFSFGFALNAVSLHKIITL